MIRVVTASTLHRGKAVIAEWPVERLSSSQAACELLPTAARLELRHKTPANGTRRASDDVQPTSEWGEVHGEHEHIVQAAHHYEASRPDRRMCAQARVTCSDAIQIAV
jgi:hypothetical protein